MQTKHGIPAITKTPMTSAAVLTNSLRNGSWPSHSVVVSERESRKGDSRKEAVTETIRNVTKNKTCFQSSPITRAFTIARFDSFDIVRIVKIVNVKNQKKQKENQKKKPEKPKEIKTKNTENGNKHFLLKCNVIFEMNVKFSIFVPIMVHI